jgi:hypothetical protein
MFSCVSTIFNSFDKDIENPMTKTIVNIIFSIRMCLIGINIWFHWLISIITTTMGRKIKVFFVIIRSFFVIILILYTDTNSSIPIIIEQYYNIYIYNKDNNIK